MEDYRFGAAPWFKGGFRYEKIHNIILEEGVTTIGRYAFESCYNLTDIDIPSSINIIGECAFMNCKNLQQVNIKNGLKVISGNAFSGCDSLNVINIPESVIRIEGIFFAECSNLKDIIVDVSNTEYASIDGALYNKEKSVLIFCPVGKDVYNIPTNVTNIGDYAFLNCKNITEITIPDNVTTLGTGVFDGCTALEKINLSNSLNRLTGELFANCTNLNEISIPESVTRIDSGVFRDCQNLNTVYLPSSIKNIGSNAFAKCVNLEKIFYVGNETQWGQINISSGNAELNSAEVIFQGGGSISNPEDNDNPSDNEPDQPVNPNDLSITKQSGCLGSKIMVQITGEHWLTIQVRRAGSIAITSIQAQGQGMVDMAFSAAAGSVVQLWETETEMTFTDGVPDNKILATVVENV